MFNKAYGLTLLSIYTLFLPQGVKIELIFALRVAVFRNTGRFFKLPYLGMKLGHWQKFQKLYIHSLSTPGGGSKLSFALQAAVPQLE